MLFCGFKIIRKNFFIESLKTVMKFKNRKMRSANFILFPHHFLKISQKLTSLWSSFISSHCFCCFFLRNYLAKIESSHRGFCFQIGVSFSHSEIEYNAWIGGQQSLKKTDQSQKDRIPPFKFVIFLFSLLHSAMLWFSLLGFFFQHFSTRADEIRHRAESPRRRRIVEIFVAGLALDPFQSLIFAEELFSCHFAQNCDKW